MVLTIGGAIVLAVSSFLQPVSIPMLKQIAIRVIILIVGSVIVLIIFITKAFI